MCPTIFICEVELTNTPWANSISLNKNVARRNKFMLWAMLGNENPASRVKSLKAQCKHSWAQTVAKYQNILWRKICFQNVCTSSSSVVFLPLLPLNQQKGTQEGLAASKSQLQVVPMKEKRTQLLVGSRVRYGRTKNPMTTLSPVWEITTSAETLMALPRCGASPWIPTFCLIIAQFPSARLRFWRL